MLDFHKVLNTVDPVASGLHVMSEKDMDTLHEVLLEMLLDIDDVCRANGIEWGLTGGTALGAIRHKGFIPWDDDIDIAMDRVNYEKFLKVFPGPFADKYHFRIPGDQGYVMNIPRIYRAGTAFRGIVTSEDRDHEIFCDVFVLENCDDAVPLRVIHGLQCMTYRFIASCVRVNACAPTLRLYTAANPELDHALAVRRRWAKLFAWRPMERWMDATFACYSRVHDGDSECVVSPAGRAQYFGELYRRKDMCRYVRVPFEGHDLPVPAGWESLLRQLYGDGYMEMPPVETRESHVVIEFRAETHENEQKEEA